MERVGIYIDVGEDFQGLCVVASETALLTVYIYL